VFEWDNMSMLTLVARQTVIEVESLNEANDNPGFVSHWEINAVLPKNLTNTQMKLGAILQIVSWPGSCSTY
jgi:hypothetical protein